MGRLRANAAGTALLIVTAVCCNAADTIQGNVNTDPPPQGYPNMPAGMTVFGRNEGTVAQSNSDAFGFSWMGAWDYDGGVLSDHIAVISDASNPTGSGQSLRFTWDPNDNPLSASASGTFPGGPFAELYIMMRIYYEEVFPSKFFYIGLPDVEGSGDFWVARESDGRLRVSNQRDNAELIDTSEGPPKGSNSRPLTVGAWRNVEFHFVAESSLGAGNGQVYVWVDGVLAGRSAIAAWNGRFGSIEWYADANGIPGLSHYRIGEFTIAGK